MPYDASISSMVRPPLRLLRLGLPSVREGMLVQGAAILSLAYINGFDLERSLFEGTDSRYFFIYI